MRLLRSIAARAIGVCSSDRRSTPAAHRRDRRGQATAPCVPCTDFPLEPSPSGLFRSGIDQPIESRVSRTRVGEREADLLSGTETARVGGAVAVIVDFDTERTAMEFILFVIGQPLETACFGHLAELLTVTPKTVGDGAGQHPFVRL